MPKPATHLPALAKAARRFERWRQARTGHRIPEELWAVAEDLASRHGVSLTSRALRLQYYALKKRVEAKSVEDSEEPSAPAFLEILTAPTPAGRECSVEFEHPGGAKMRISLSGAEDGELQDLTRLFLESRA